MEPGQFGTVGQVIFPVPEIAAIIGPVDVMGEITAVEDTAAAQAEAIASQTEEQGL